MHVFRRSLLYLILCLAIPALGVTNPFRQPEPNLKKAEEAANRPIGFYQNRSAVNSNHPVDHLSQATALLEKGKEKQACVHLARYLDQHPDQFEVRIRYADLLLRLGRITLAKGQFRRFISDTQDQIDDHYYDHLYCLRRLMDIAEFEDDFYGFHLQRGISLYLLSQRRAKLSDPNGEFSVEGILCKAAQELCQARIQEKNQARPCWYLYLVWSKLGQSQLARSYLRETNTLAPFSVLTIREQRDLQLLYRQEKL